MFLPELGNLFTAEVAINETQHYFLIYSLDLTSETNPAIRCEAEGCTANSVNNLTREEGRRKVKRDHPGGNSQKTSADCTRSSSRSSETAKNPTLIDITR